MDEARLTLGSWRHIGDMQDLMQHSFGAWSARADHAILSLRKCAGREIPVFTREPGRNGAGQSTAVARSPAPSGYECDLPASGQHSLQC